MRGWLMSLLQAEVPLFFLVILRLVIGGELLAQGNDKVKQGYLQRIQDPKQEGERSNPLQLTLDIWTDEMEEKGVFPWYRTFLEKAVLQNTDVFAIVVTVAELALGAMLVLGLLVRVASAFGILLILNYFFATWHYGFPYPVLNILFLATLFVLAVAGAGRCLGLDSLLHDRFPEIPLF